MSRAPARRLAGGNRNRSGSERMARIGGHLIAYEEGLDEHLRNNRAKPMPTYPPYDPGKPKALSKNEREEVTRFLRIRERFRDGPLYAAVGTSNETPAFSPFEGMGAYSQKYIKRARTLPRLNTKPRALHIFPKELWSVVEPKRGTSNGISKVRRGPPQRKTTPVIKFDLVDDDDEEVEENVDEEQQEQEEDDEYESDEEEMAGDYNAEKYFDAGDEVDDWEGDGGDGGDAYS